jgi:hypothetical protein
MIAGKRTAVRPAAHKAERRVVGRPIVAISRARGAVTTIVIGSDGIASDRVA